MSQHISTQGLLASCFSAVNCLHCTSVAQLLECVLQQYRASVTWQQVHLYNTFIKVLKKWTFINPFMYAHFQWQWSSMQAMGATGVLCVLTCSTSRAMATLTHSAVLLDLLRSLIPGQWPLTLPRQCCDHLCDHSCATFIHLIRTKIKTNKQNPSEFQLP